MTQDRRVEIERRFLVKSNDWTLADDLAYVGEFTQGYLQRDPLTIRVRVQKRLINPLAWLTVKSKVVNYTRDEIETSIDYDAGLKLLRLCDGPKIVKHRYNIMYYGEHLWSLDVFQRENAGLVIAEIELDYEGEEFTRPDWLGEEVSHDHRYFNSNLPLKE